MPSKSETIVQHLAVAVATIKNACEAGDLYAAEPVAMTVELQPLAEAVREIREAAELVEELGQEDWRRWALRLEARLSELGHPVQVSLDSRIPGDGSALRILGVPRDSDALVYLDDRGRVLDKKGGKNA